VLPKDKLSFGEGAKKVSMTKIDSKDKMSSYKRKSNEKWVEMRIKRY